MNDKWREKQTKSSFYYLVIDILRGISERYTKPVFFYLTANVNIKTSNFIKI